MIKYTILFLLASAYCSAQYDYKATLASKIEQIKQSDHIQDDVIVFGKNIGYDGKGPCCPVFHSWSSATEYYLRDIVKKNGNAYEAMADGLLGINPEASNLWRLLDSGYHPYQFLRDSAKVEDLINLVAEDNPCVKSFAFAALSHRKYDGLYQLVIDNLKDTSKIYFMTGVVQRGLVSPVVIMLEHCIESLNEKQKMNIKNLIIEKYPHLKSIYNFDKLQ